MRRRLAPATPFPMELVWKSASGRWARLYRRQSFAIWLFEVKVISLKGIYVPSTSVVKVQGDVAQFHFDVLDILATNPRMNRGGVVAKQGGGSPRSLDLLHGLVRN